MSNFAHARIHEFETTHLKSTAGTGVSSILAEEAAFLNPASLSFFNNGSVYFQRDMLQLKDDKGNIVQKPKSTGVVLADGNASLSGTVSYVHQEEGAIKRSRWGASASAPLSPGSAFGFSMRKTKDENTLTNKKIDYYQSVFGVTHSIDTQSSVGVVVYDAFKSKGQATKAIVGAQHVFVDYITIGLDFGANYTAEEISESLLYRGSVQVRVLDDFYLRFGAFKDKEHDEKGNGFGLAWIQPRLALEFALKNTTQDADTTINRTESKIKEMSFAASLRF